MESIHVIPLQQHLGVFSYLVFNGPDHGKQVFVRAYRPEWYEEQFRTTDKFSNYDRASFQLNVLDEVGIVHDHDKKVSPDVVQAVWVDLQKHRARRPDIFVDSITTGFKSIEIGWVKSNFRTLPVGISREIPIDAEGVTDFNGILAASLAARHRANA